MKVIKSLDTPLHAPHPITFTIGTFDGMHLGHQALLRKLTGTKVVLTFSNHPQEVLQGRSIDKLCSTEEKVALMEQLGIDTLYLIPFTKAFSLQSPEEFLRHIRSAIPFDRLILGEDAVIGRNRAGTPERLRPLAEEMGFALEYIPDIEIEGVRPSSTLIRRLLSEGNRPQAERLLGRHL